MHKFRFVLIGAAMVLASAAASYAAVSAAMPGALLAAGTTRYAFVSAVAQTDTASTSFVNLPGLSTTISIPAGKTADVFILFCGDTVTTNFTSVRALVGGSRATPAEAWIREPAASGGGNETGCANFLKKDVPSGTQTIAMQWRGSSAAAWHSMFDRTMVVIANIH